MMTADAAISFVGISLADPPRPSCLLSCSKFRRRPQLSLELPPCLYVHVHELFLESQSSWRLMRLYFSVNPVRVLQLARLQNLLPLPKARPEGRIPLLHLRRQTRSQQRRHKHQLPRVIKVNRVSWAIWSRPQRVQWLALSSDTA